MEARARPESIAVTNPATGDVIAQVPLSSREDVANAVKAATGALPAWRRTPAKAIIVQPLFRLKALLDEDFSDIARLIRKAAARPSPKPKAS